MDIFRGDIIGDHSKQGSPRACDNELAVVITAEDDDLTPGSGRSRCKVSSKVVASPIASKRDPSRMRVSLLSCVGRLRVLALLQVLSPERIACGLGLRNGGCCGRAGKGLDRDLGRTVVRFGGEVLFGDLAPVLPLHDNLFAVEQHHAEQDASGQTTALLAVVDLQRLADVHGESSVELVLQLVDVVCGTALAEVVKQLLVVVLNPAINALPGMGDGRRGRQALVEVLHLDLAVGALVEGIRVGGGLAAQRPAHAWRIRRAGRHGALGRANEAIAGRNVVVCVWRGEVDARVDAAGRNRGQGAVAALRDGNMAPGAVRRVVRGVAVVRGHGVPEVLQGRSYSGQMLAMAANVVVVVCAGGGAREACEGM